MKKIGLYIIVIMFFSNAGCDIVEGSHPEGYQEGPPRSIAVKLTNNDLEEAHMWVTGENIGPSNKLQPGESRETSYWKSSELMKGEIKEETMTIYAGRNGVTLATKSYSISIDSEWSPRLKVKFTGTKIR